MSSAGTLLQGAEIGFRVVAIAATLPKYLRGVSFPIQETNKPQTYVVIAADT